MANKSERLFMVLWVILIIAILLIGGCLFYGSASKQSSYSAAPNIDPQRTSLSHIFRSTIDPLAPDFIHQRELACIAVHGTWIESDDRIGCFDVPDWDSRLCSTAVITQLRNTCEGIADADWVCDQHQVGCIYD